MVRTARAALVALHQSGVRFRNYAGRRCRGMFSRPRPRNQVVTRGNDLMIDRVEYDPLAGRSTTERIGCGMASSRAGDFLSAFTARPN
jgi:hypothetical protein